MAAVSALVILLNLTLALIIGIRLMRKSFAEPNLAESLLSIYFIFTPFCGSILSITSYATVSDVGVSLSPQTVSVFLATAMIFQAVGSSCIYVFTQSTYRMEDYWPKVLVSLGMLAMILTAMARGLTEGFAIRPLPNMWYWTFKVAYATSFVWLAVESLRYWRLMKKRQKLGLADGVTTNQFLLWGVWSGTIAAASLSDVVTRLIYFWVVGGVTNEIDIAQTAPLIQMTLIITSSMGLTGATCLLLSYFPSQRYLRWIESRAPAAAAAEGSDG